MKTFYIFVASLRIENYLILTIDEVRRFFLLSQNFNSMQKKSFYPFTPLSFYSFILLSLSPFLPSPFLPSPFLRYTISATTN